MSKGGNKGDWSEPYALLKLIADGKLYLGADDFTKIKGLFYPIIQVLRHEKGRDVKFSYSDNLVVITDGQLFFKVPLVKFVTNAKLCLESILSTKGGKGSFELPKIKAFLSSFSITSLKAKSQLKNDITIQIQDPHTFITPSLGFSIKSQLGSPSTLVNASNVTNFTYQLIGGKLRTEEIESINSTKKFSDKFKLLGKAGIILQFETVENKIFKSNLQTIDYNFEKILSEVIVHFYSSSSASENTIPKFISKVTETNSIGYDLSVNSDIYELIMKRFLTEYALGMRAAEVWKRNYQATGGYLIVRKDGELICYHFYFTKNFEDYLFATTQLCSPGTTRHKYGKIYNEDGKNKIKLNLQIRFIT